MTEKITEDKVQRILDWDAMPDGEKRPKTKVALAKSLGISTVTIFNVLNNKPDETGDEFERFMEHLKREVYKFNCPVRRQEIYAQLMGWKVDKSERKYEFDLDATSYNRIATEVTERLRENQKKWGGICPVCSQHQALCGKPHMDTEPEHAEDREVGRLAISTRPD